MVSGHSGPVPVTPEQIKCSGQTSAIHWIADKAGRRNRLGTVLLAPDFSANRWAEANRINYALLL